METDEPNIWENNHIYDLQLISTCPEKSYSSSLEEYYWNGILINMHEAHHGT